MAASLVVTMLGMGGFVFAETLWQFALFSILNGIGGSLFYPAANAQVADVVPADRRAEVFAALHAALNVGAAFGPALGLLVFAWQPKVVFAISAVSFALYLLLVLRYIPETLPRDGRVSNGGADGGASQGDGAGAAEREPRLAFRQHRLLFAMTGLAIPISLLYSQVETVFPLHLQNVFANDKLILTTLLTLNGLTVMLLQIPVARWTEHWATHRVVLLVYGLLALVAFGYGFAPWFALLIAAELLFTLGEMLNGPHMQKAIARIAPERMRGRYFSVYSMSWQLARGVGPITFGFLFERYGGRVSFAVIAALLLVAGAGQYGLMRGIDRPKPAPTAGGAAAEA